MAILSTALSKSGKNGIFLVNKSEILRKIEDFKDETERKIESGVIRMGLKAASLVQDKTPVEYGDLKASIQFSGLKKENGSYRGEIGSSGLSYAEAVEYGVQGRTYKYSVAGKGDVVGVGAGMFRKTVDSTKDNQTLENILIDALN